MSTIRVTNLQHTDATEPNIVLQADGTSVFASGITISGGTNLTVSGTAEFASGTVSAPGITFIDDNNTGIYEPAVDTFAITTAATERLRIDSSGNVGIGTSSPVQQSGIGLHINNAGGQARIKLTQSGSGATANDGFDIIAETGNNVHLLNHENAALKFGTNDAEQMRLGPTGHLGIGTASPTDGDGFGRCIDIQSGTGGAVYMRHSSDTTNDTFIIGRDAANSYLISKSGNIIFNNNNGERMRIDSAGNIGINQTSVSSTRKLEITQPSSYSGALRINSALSSGNPGYIEWFSGASQYKIGINHSTDALKMFRDTTEMMRFDSSGKIRIRCQDYSADPSASNAGLMLFDTGGGGINSAGFGTGSESHMVIMNTNGVVGTIQSSGSSTSYNTSSDYRIKENVVTMTDGISRVKQLLPKRFNFIADADTIVDGFLAHEAQTVVPEAVTGEKDGEKMQGIDQSKLVPLLTAALQEAITRIETLETRIATLENN